MKVEIITDPQLNKPEIVIRTPSITPEILTLASELRHQSDGSTLTVFRENEAFILRLPTILRFFADGKGVSCQTEEETYCVRQRLYALEDHLAGTRFVRVSHSEIINLDHVTALDLSLSGTIRITLTGGATAYASRRYVKKLKQAVGL